MIPTSDLEFLIVMGSSLCSLEYRCNSSLYTGISHTGISAVLSMWYNLLLDEGRGVGGDTLSHRQRSWH